MTAPQPEMPQPDYEILRQRVATMASIMPHTGPGRETLGTPEFFNVSRVASQGVLRQLQDAGIQEAGTLAFDLTKMAEDEQTADLSFTVADRYRQSQAQAGRERDTDVNAQTQQQRMALLAEAAGQTASAIVTSVLNPDNIDFLVTSGETAVAEYGKVARNKAGVTLLKGLLEQAAEAAADQPEQRAA